jgi:uncharacterized membrane protein YjjP (DUF1212 family)
MEIRRLVMHNTIDLEKINNVLELDNLLKNKKISFDDFRYVLNKLKRTSYTYNTQGEPINIVHHEGKSPFNN